MHKEIAGIMLFTLFTVGPIFQLVTLIRTKNSESLSTTFYWINTVGQICSLMYNAHVESTFWTTVNAISGIVTNFITLYFIGLYGKRRERKVL